MSCEYCHREDEQLMCKAHSPKMPVVCTRPLGHKGMHVACGLKAHYISAWVPGEENEDGKVA